MYVKLHHLFFTNNKILRIFSYKFLLTYVKYSTKKLGLGKLKYKKYKKKTEIVYSSYDFKLIEETILLY